MASDNVLPYIVALGGSTGIGMLLREIVSVITLAAKGVSPREGKRKVDIVQQRDEALRDKAAAEVRADHEAARRRQLEEYSSRLRRQLFDYGFTVDQVEAYPDQHTLTRAEIRKRLKEHNGNTD